MKITLTAACFFFYCSFISAQQVNIAGLTIKMVLTKKYCPDFETAAKAQIDSIEDGDSLWLYIQANKPFKDIVTVKRTSQADGSVLKRSVLMLRLGPNKDWAPYNDNCELCFGGGKECAYLDRIPAAFLEKNEIGLNLTSYNIAGSSKVMLSTVATGMPGNWDNQVRLYIGDNQVASARLFCKVEDGIAKYRKMWTSYKDKLEKGDETTNELPQPGTFINAGISVQVTKFVQQQGILPGRIFFTQNNWTEVDASVIERHRYVTAVITYQKAGKCYFTVVQVRQNYSFSSTRYGDATFSLQDKDIPVLCKK